MFDKLVDLLVSWIKLFFFLYTLHPFQRGIVLRLGKYVKDVGPGIHWRWPFDIDEILYEHVAADSIVIGPQSLTTRDDVTVVVSVLVSFQVSDVRIVLLETSGVQKILQRATYGVVADFVTKHTWAQLRDVASDEGKDLDLDNEIAKAARRRAKKQGVHIFDIQFSDLTKSRSVRLIGSLPTHGV